MSSATAQAKEGKYLTFALGGEDYGLEILKVREIIGMMSVTPVPQVPAHMKGVINLRGKVIPVIDLRLKFGMPPVDPTPETCIIVVNLHEVLVGVIIDQVKDVLDIRKEQIEPAPSFGADSHADFVVGIAKVETTVKILLDIDRALASDTGAVGAVAGG